MAATRDAGQVADALLRIALGRYPDASGSPIFHAGRLAACRSRCAKSLGTPLIMATDEA